MTNRLFIIDNGGVSLQYGIGTYIDGLVNALKYSDMEIVVVEMFSIRSSIEIILKEHCTYLFLPDWNRECKYGIDYDHQYLRNVAAYLAVHFEKKDGEQQICHLNFVDTYFIEVLKKYMNCAIIVTIHYVPWNFVYKGDEEKVLRIWFGKHILYDVNAEKVTKQIENFYQGICLCNKVICLTSKRKTTFLKMFDISDTKYIVIPNAFVFPNSKRDNFVKEKIKNRLLQNSNAKIVLYVGRLDSDKNIESLIRCYKKGH